jgi:hypothetical protein
MTASRRVYVDGTLCNDIRVSRGRMPQRRAAAKLRQTFSGLINNIMSRAPIPEPTGRQA